MSDLKAAVLELNRRLLHREPRADLEQTIYSSWFDKATYSYDHKGKLRMLARVCSIARRQYTQNPCERTLTAKRTAFIRLGWEAGEVLYNNFDGPDKRPLAARCFASFLKESNSDPQLVEAAKNILMLCAKRPFGFAIERHQIGWTIRKNIDESWRHSGWDSSIRPHMFVIASLVKSAPTHELTSILATRALVCASASVSACGDLVKTHEPERFGGEGLFRKQREFGKKSLVVHIAESATKTADIVMDAYGFDGITTGCPEVLHALRLKARCVVMLHMAKPKIEAMEAIEAERNVRFEEQINPRRSQLSTKTSSVSVSPI